MTLCDLRSLPPFPSRYYFLVFFFTATAPTEIYTLSLHDALPISLGQPVISPNRFPRRVPALRKPSALSSRAWTRRRDRKSTRLNSSHVAISYAVFCLKKKKKEQHIHHQKQLHTQLQRTIHRTQTT